MRRFLRSIACAWLACQMIAVASPLALSCDGFGIDHLTCCPGIGPGQICPMHHKSTSDRTTCRMENPCGHHDTMLLTMIAVGILPPASIAIVSSPFHTWLGSMAESTLGRAVRPDSPPPRFLAS
jgi:hypothetical protein